MGLPSNCHVTKIIINNPWLSSSQIKYFNNFNSSVTLHLLHNQHSPEIFLKKDSISWHHSVNSGLTLTDFSVANSCENISASSIKKYYGPIWKTSSAIYNLFKLRQRSFQAIFKSSINYVLSFNVCSLKNISETIFYFNSTMLTIWTMFTNFGH